MAYAQQVLAEWQNHTLPSVYAALRITGAVGVTPGSDHQELSRLLQAINELIKEEAINE